MAPTQLSIVLERLLNELGIANLSMFEAVLMHDTGAVLDAIRSTAAAAEAGAAAYASSATSNVVVSPGSFATAGVISVQHKGSFSRTLVSTDAQNTLMSRTSMQPRVVRVLRCCSGRSWKRSCGHRPRSSLLSSALRAL